MTNELRIGIVDGAIVVEVWRGGEAIATVHGVDDGVRIVAKHRRLSVVDTSPRAVTVRISP
jgi:hypothetical protein